MNLFKKAAGIFLSCFMAVSVMTVPAKDVHAVTVNGDKGTFSVCSMNVDGLPNKILVVDLNKDGPGSDGTKKISAKMNEYQWDIIGVAEDFNYNKELLSSLTNYKSGTHRGGVSGLSNNTDGLNLIWKKTINVTGEKWTHWTTNYSTGFANTGNGADGMIDKGFRYYQAEIADGVKVDVYILHMDADSDQGDIDAREAQLVQLKNTIIASDNKNPIIVMGDTNCRYTREHVESSFIGGINADPRFTMKDAWIEHIYNGTYPVYGADAIVAKDKGGTYDYPQAEIVDKIFYINNTDSDVQISALNYVVNTDFVGTDGKALADHWPISVDFTYEKTTAHTHDYKETVKEATCTEDGVKTFTCKCGDSYTERIPAKGHSYTETVQDSTCDKEGTRTYTCTCGDSYTEVIPVKGHSYNAVVTAPTCTSEGYTTYTCAVCGDSYTADKQVMSAHSYKDGICTVCGAADPDYVPEVHEHAYSVTVQDADCIHEGVKTYTCSCGDTYTETILAKGHSYKSKVTAPTCTTGGYTTYTCSVCGSSYTDNQLPANGHTYVNGTCTVCKEKDPNYTPTNPSEGNKGWGDPVSKLESGKKYGIVYHGTNGSYSLKHDSSKVSNTPFSVTDTVDDSLVWTVSEVKGGYTISADVNGKTKYLARSKTLTNSGYTLVMQDSPFTWTTKIDAASKTVNFYTKIISRNYYLRYYTDKTGFIVSTQAAGVRLYEVNE